MKNFSFIIIPFFIFLFGVFALAKSVRFQPWTKPGQEEQYKEYRKVIAMPALGPDAEKAPELEFDKTTFDFGVMPPFVNGEHVFTVRNSGDFDLALKGTKKSCSCLEVSMGPSIVAPGDSRQVKVTWNTDKPGKFAQYVSVISNCPGKESVDLWVEGTVATILDASRGSLGFDDLLPGESRSQQFHLFSHIWDSFDIDRIETSSDLILCERVPSPTQEAQSAIEKKSEAAVEVKHRIDLKMTAVPRDTSGVLRGYVRLFVRPPKGALERDAGEIASQYSLRGMANATQDDGTLLIHLPVELYVKRRFGLYSPIISDADRMMIELGKLKQSASKGKTWNMIARIRGEIQPTDFRVSLVGLPGVSAKTEKAPVSSQAVASSSTYRISITADEELRPAIYDRETAGKLVIECPGLTGEERTEFTVNLDVLPDE